MEYTETVGGIQISVTDADGGNIRVMDNGFVRDIDIDGNYKRKQFTVQDVHLGDIIDIRYEIVGVFPQYYEKQVDSTSNFDDFGFMTRTGTGDDIILPAWDFQDEIPVVKSELEFVYFDEYRFDAIITGGDNVVKEEQQGGVYKRMNRQVVKRKHFTISSPGNIDTEVKKENVNSHMSKFQGYFTEKNLKKMKFTALLWIL